MKLVVTISCSCHIRAWSCRSTLWRVGWPLCWRWLSRCVGYLSWMSLRAIACLLPSVFTCLSVPFALGPFGIGSVITATRSIHVSVYSRFFFSLILFIQLQQSCKTNVKVRRLHWLHVIPEPCVSDSTPCSKKVPKSCLMFDNNFGKCGPIFKILSPIDSWENSLCTCRNDFHLTCSVLLHYLVKVENPKNVTDFNSTSTDYWHVLDDTLRTWFNI